MLTVTAPQPHISPETQPLSVVATRPIRFSLGIMAWNEAGGIVRTLESLFRQSVFAHLALRDQRCEIFCLANGCTDGTVSVSRRYFELMDSIHPWAETFSLRVMDIEQPGRNNAWNRFVHNYSNPESRYIFLMDADIIFQNPDSILNLFTALEQNAHADVSSGRQLKDIEFKPHKSLLEKISIATSTLTGTIDGRFSGQLYCMRSSIARRLYLPRDLGATDDGFFKAVICSEFFAHKPDGSRIAQVPGSAHSYEAYITPQDVLNNQKRQMIGQAQVHVLVEHLKTLPAAESTDLAALFVRWERDDPDWLKDLLEQHFALKYFFWELFPGLLTFRFKRLGKLPGLRKLTHLPATLVGFIVTMIACSRAFHFLKQGRIYYWPKASRPMPVNSSTPARS
jgi:glycosyltransferase involved in cell wall biosynthesis